MRLEITPPQCWLANAPIDFRVGIDGLCRYVSEQWPGKQKEGVFIFYSKDRKKVKLLGWHRNGFVLVYKRFSSGRLHISTDNQSQVVLNKDQLSWLLAGLDWPLMSSCDELAFEDFY